MSAERIRLRTGIGSGSAPDPGLKSGGGNKTPARLIEMAMSRAGGYERDVTGGGAVSYDFLWTVI